MDINNNTNTNTINTETESVKTDTISETVTKSEPQNTNTIASSSVISSASTSIENIPATSSNSSLKRSRDEAESINNAEVKEETTNEENYQQFVKKTKKDNLMIKKEKSWTEFLLQLDDYTPIVKINSFYINMFILFYFFLYQ